MGSAEGAEKTAARRIGLLVDDYRAKIVDGLKWCTLCRVWHEKSNFAVDSTRAGGLSPKCRDSKNTFQISLKPGRVRKRPDFPIGRRRTEPRDDDRVQARGRVTHLVNFELIPPANSLPCSDCGHVSVEGDKTHEYDHHLGYGPEHHEDVQPVCRRCHVKREIQRGARGNRWRKAKDA